MNIALVGCGNISRVHIKAIGENKTAKLVAVADIKKERADGVASKTGAKAYYDLDSMLQSESIDVLHICTPHYLHTEMALKALDRGINVLIEKPCSVTFDEIEKLKSAQQKSGKQVATCFQNRYNTATVKAKEIIDSGRYGKINCMRGIVTWCRNADYYSDDWHGQKDKECGGVLINQSIHTIDILQYFAGGLKLVKSHIANDHLEGVIDVEDNASLLMKNEAGVTALLYATTAYGENSDVLIEVTLEKAVLRIEGDVLWLREDGKIFEVTEAPKKEDFPGQKYWGTGHSALINDFYDCVACGRWFTIDAVEGSKAAAIVIGAYND